MKFNGISRGLVATAVLTAGATTALAGNDVVFRIEALTDGSLSVYEVNFADGTWSDDGLRWEWAYNGDGYFFGSGEGGVDMGLGGFDDAGIVFDFTSRGGPAQTVNLNFDVFAGAANTAFSIGSGPLGFAEFASAEGIASASVGVTDVLGGGATLGPDGAGMYRAFYNGGTTFSDLLTSSLVAGQFSSAQDDESFGFAALAGAVDEIAAEWNFTLTAFDSAGGTSTFSVIPAPGSAMLLALAGLTATRRRR